MLVISNKIIWHTFTRDSINEINIEVGQIGIENVGQNLNRYYLICEFNNRSKSR